jgi:hypothetical protein
MNIEDIINEELINLERDIKELNLGDVTYKIAQISPNYIAMTQNNNIIEFCTDGIKAQARIFPSFIREEGIRLVVRYAIWHEHCHVWQFKHKLYSILASILAYSGNIIGYGVAEHEEEANQYAISCAKDKADILFTKMERLLQRNTGAISPNRKELLTCTVLYYNLVALLILRKLFRSRSEI